MRSRPRTNRKDRAAQTLRIVTLALLAVLPGTARGADDPAAKKPPAGKAAPSKATPKKGTGLEWMSLEKGILRMREKYVPALVLFEPAAEGATPETADAGAPAFVAEPLTEIAVKDVFKKFVLIRLTAGDLKQAYPSPSRRALPAPAKGEKGKAEGPKAGAGDAPPPGVDHPLAVESTVEGRLGVLQGKPALFALSFWEEVVLRYEGELPSRTQVKKDLGRIWKVSGIYAAEARKVEPELETSRYAFKLGNFRDAVKKVIPFEDKKAQDRMDPVLKRRVNEVIQDCRAKAQEAIAAGDKLDQDRKYVEAIDAFDKVIANFPFPDVAQHANKRKGELLRKLTLGR